MAWQDADWKSGWVWRGSAGPQTCFFALPVSSVHLESRFAAG